MEQKRRNGQKIVWGNTDVENKTEILYNETVEERDVAQFGSAFVLGTKCHRFKSCHPYLLLLLLKGAVTRDQWRSIQSGQNLSFLSYYEVGKNTLLYSLIYSDKKALLVQFGRTWVSKTRCRRFKSYRA